MPVKITVVLPHLTKKSSIPMGNMKKMKRVKLLEVIKNASLELKPTQKMK